MKQSWLELDDQLVSSESELKVVKEALNNGGASGEAISQMLEAKAALEQDAAAWGNERASLMAQVAELQEAVRQHDASSENATGLGSEGLLGEEDVSELRRLLQEERLQTQQLIARLDDATNKEAAWQDEKKRWEQALTMMKEQEMRNQKVIQDSAAAMADLKNKVKSTAEDLVQQGKRADALAGAKNIEEAIAAEKAITTLLIYRKPIFDVATCHLPPDPDPPPDPTPNLMLCLLGLMASRQKQIKGDHQNNANAGNSIPADPVTSRGQHGKAAWRPGRCSRSYVEAYRICGKTTVRVERREGETLSRGETDRAEG